MFEIQQDAFVKLIDFRRFLFALSFFLKEPKLEQVLKSSGRRFQVSTARCLKEDLPISVLGLSISILKDFLKL